MFSKELKTNTPGAPSKIFKDEESLHGITVGLVRGQDVMPP